MNLCRHDIADKRQKILFQQCGIAAAGRPVPPGSEERDELVRESGEKVIGRRRNRIRTDSRLAQMAYVLLVQRATVQPADDTARHILERQPREARNASMLTALTKPNLDPAAGAFIRAWLVKKHVAMLMDFLNALEIKNDNGVVEDLPGAVDDAKLKAAVELLLGKYPHETVAVYLNAFNDMNAAGWANLKALLENDARLQLGNHA